MTRTGLALLALLGLALAGQGLWIKGKAVVAQVLLRHAWADTLRTRQAQAPWPWADMAPAARLRAPDLGVDLIVLDSLSGQALAFGPGLYRRGADGPILLAGHKDTHFRFLGRLRDGDRLHLTLVDGRTRSYRVAARLVLQGERLSLSDGATGLMLTTCYPLGPGASDPDRRFVLLAEPASAS